MPSHASPKKRLRRDANKIRINKSRISSLRTFVKKVKENPQDNDAFRLAQSALATTASKGIIHPNAASRRISRLMKQHNAAVLKMATNLAL